MSSTDAASRVDFFISYTGADQAWAEWIAWNLEEAGFSLLIHTWDLPAAGDFVTFPVERLDYSHRTLVVGSREYFTSPWCTEEWTSVLTGRDLLPVRVEPAEPPPGLREIEWVDLFAQPEGGARKALRRAAGLKKAPPSPLVAHPPEFPGRLPEDDDLDVFRDLLERSSLGTTGARELRNKVQPDDAVKTVQAALCDFFVSYAPGDSHWAEFVERTLSEAGHRVVLDQWDLAIGGDLVAWSRRRLPPERPEHGGRTIAILSPESARFPDLMAEWVAAGRSSQLVPVRVERCTIPSELGDSPIVDLVDRDGWSTAALLRSAARSPDLQPSFTLLALEPAVPAAETDQFGWRTDFLVLLYEAADATGLDPSEWVAVDGESFLLFLIPSDTPTRRVSEDLVPRLRTGLARRNLEARVATHHTRIRLSSGKLARGEIPLMRQLLDASRRGGLAAATPDDAPPASSGQARDTGRPRPAERERLHPGEVAVVAVATTATANVLNIPLDDPRAERVRRAALSAYVDGKISFKQAQSRVRKAIERFQC